MGVRKFVTVKLAVQDFMDDVDMQDQRKFPVYMRWAARADQNIGGFNSYNIKIAVITINRCVATLPCDAIALLPGFLWGDYGCECGTVFNTMRSNFYSGVLKINTVGAFTVIDATSVSYSCFWRKYNLQDNKMIFPADFDGQKITVQYLAYKTDCDGFIMVNENHIDAINHFCQMQLARQTRFSTKEYRLTEAAIRNIEREYHRLVRRARADDGEQTAEERASTVNLINNALSGHADVYWLYWNQIAA